MEPRTASAPGKIILTGEYAVVFGYPGIAIPSQNRMEVEYIPSDQDLTIEWENGWNDYVSEIVKQINPETTGIIKISNDLPLGKGMGSSTALIVALSKAILGPLYTDEKALEIESHFSPNHSGIDFSVIASEHPLKFIKGNGVQPITIDEDRLQDIVLIDTGTPDQPTAELVSWVKDRSEEEDIKSTLKTIGNCTSRLESGEDPAPILKDHHQAQVTLGVVPTPVQKLITEIEIQGGAAKVIGAGSRTGGGGIVLALHKDKNRIKQLAEHCGYATL